MQVQNVHIDKFTYWVITKNSICNIKLQQSSPYLALTGTLKLTYSVISWRHWSSLHH